MGHGTSLQPTDDSEDELLRMAAAAEERSNHPLAHAVVDAARERGLSWQPADEVQILPGRGVSAIVEGQSCLLGNEALLGEFSVQLPKEIEPPEQGVTRLWMAVDGAAVGYFDARDALRPDAAESIAALRGAGFALMLTGDSAVAAAPIAEQAGIGEVEAGLDPAGKLARIRKLQQGRDYASGWSATVSTMRPRWRRPMQGFPWVAAPISRRRPATSCSCGRNRGLDRRH